MRAMEAETENEIEATLEMNDGATQVSVFVTARRAEGVPTGYLRLAYGQGNYINRLLSSVGQRCQLVAANGVTRSITILSCEPKDISGYLCSFSFGSDVPPPSRAAGRGGRTAASRVD